MGITNWLQDLFSRPQEQKQVPKQENELEEISESLRKIQKRERRNSQYLEIIHKEISSKLDLLQSSISRDLPYDSISEFASSFGLYVQHYQDRDRALQSIWSKFINMLQDLDFELILDANCTYDDTRHEVCDTRCEMDYPEGWVLEVVQPGIIFQGRLARPAKVVVNKSSSQEMASA